MAKCPICGADEGACMGVTSHLNPPIKPFGSFMEEKMDSVATWKADKSYWLTADGEITDNRDEGVTLLCRQGTPLSLSLATRYGLTEGKRPDGVKIHAAALSGVNVGDHQQANAQGFKPDMAEHPAFKQKGEPPAGTPAARKQAQERGEASDEELAVDDRPSEAEASAAGAPQPGQEHPEGALSTANTAEGESAAATAPDAVEEMEDAEGKPEGVRTKAKGK